MSAMLPVALPPRGAVPNAAARRGRPGGSRPQARLATRCFVSDKRGGKATSFPGPATPHRLGVVASARGPGGADENTRAPDPDASETRGSANADAEAGKDGAEAFRRWLLETELPKSGKSVARSLSSLPLAISEFLAIAGFSALGTVIEQNKGTAWYVQNYPTETPAFGFIDYPLILDLGLDHIYTEWYFRLCDLCEKNQVRLRPMDSGEAQYLEIKASIYGNARKASISKSGPMPTEHTPARRRAQNSAALSAPGTWQAMPTTAIAEAATKAVA